MRLALLLLLGISLAPPLGRAQSIDAIRLNQIGFYPETPKVAVVVGASDGAFYVTTPGGADTVFTGVLGTATTWAPSGETARQADFTAVRAPGAYVVSVPGLGSSHEFTVGPSVHQELARAALKGFYYQRASTALDPAHAGRWARPAGHPDTEVRVHASAASQARPEGTLLAAPKGWYDAGDYNKYIVNSGITTGTLLMLYEHFPAYFEALELGIPESGNGVPDVLDEVLWNLRWMLAMQDPNDGGVYHKLTTPNFEGMVMPDQARQPRYVVQKSTPAALDFAAVMALAARVFDDFEAAVPGFADSSLAAARAAWNWALAHDDVAYRQQAVNEQYDPDINTGEYGDGSFSDEFRWTATELFVTTGDPAYLSAHDPLAESVGVPGWPNVGTMAYYTLAQHQADVAAAVDTLAVRQRLIAAADQLVGAWQQSAYGTVMGRNAGDFFWGSNSYAANQGILLLQAYRLTGDDRYLHAALSNLDYLLGRNATGYAFVTGYGDKTPMHPHHRPSEADGISAPVPGLLAGGPNPGRQDQGNCPSYPSTLPAKAFLDHVCSYASNEIAINWNAPLAYLAGALEALLSPTGLPVSSERMPEQPKSRGNFGLVTYPNPVRTSTVAAFELVDAAHVTMVVYDLLGRASTRPVDHAYLLPGRHDVPIDVSRLANGAYVLNLQVNEAAAAQLLFVAN